MRSMSEVLQQPVDTLKGVGPAVAEKLRRLGIHCCGDLLFHLPLRYEDRTRLVSIGSLRPGQTALIEGRIEGADVRPGPRRSLTCLVSDGTGWLALRFFHFHPGQLKTMVRGRHVRCFGEARAGRQRLEMVHPEIRFFDGSPPPLAAHLTPVYPVTEGLAQARLRQLVEQVLGLLERGQLDDLLPQEWLSPDLPSLADSLRCLHRPPAGAAVDAILEGHHPAVQRLALEELTGRQVAMQQARRKVRHRQAPVLARHGLANRLRQSLPFALTAAQDRVFTEVARDMAQPRPMMRLVQGDVGCGKTLVAAMAALVAVEDGYQAAIMAPTEILSEQHARNLKAWLDPLEVPVVWLAGKQKGKARQEALDAIRNSEPSVVVGTHALFQEEVQFARLGLVIVDEQHRFGVHQRLALRQKGMDDQGRAPHQLIMTATPIPRTLTMTAYADLDVSIIDELPPGRQPVQTVVVSDTRRDEVMQRVREACQQGRQAYWVCTLIDDSEAVQAKAAESTAEWLREQLPGISVGLVHGRMKADEKEAVMAAFKAGAISLLVATTVIEVGVDVPNASLMIIENPERLGLAQLHQLRGRVGRGTAESHCVLLYHPPLSETGRARLAIMRATQDGFRIAEEDLRLRGPGDVLGTQQTGLLRFRVADVTRDQALIPHAMELARRLLRERPAAAHHLARRWQSADVAYVEA